MTDRSSTTGRPLKPTLAVPRGIARTPLTPRIAGSASPTVRSTGPKTPSTVRSEPPKVTPRDKQQDGAGGDALSAINVTPRSSARKSRRDSNSTTPTQSQGEDTPNAARPRSTLATTSISGERNGNVGGLSMSGGRVSRPKSLVSDSGTTRGRSPPLVRSPGRFDLSRATADVSIESRFFHASDAPKQEPVAKRAEPKKGPAFLYADGQKEEARSRSPRALSPVVSAVSEKRISGPWIRDESLNPSKSPPMLSPALSSISSVSPFFAVATGPNKARSPSPSKENIHLSYRKGASQIFGTRPTPRTTDTPADLDQGRTSLTSAFSPHRKSPSLSSIDSGNSHQSRRRSATAIDVPPVSSPLNQEVKSATVPRVAKAPQSIDTSMPILDVPTIPQTMLSPTKSVSELASDARRERKVLDLEISNSSLLAINASLEREVRRQKTELKRFRRLSRAGRFSFNPSERSARFSEGLSTVGELEGEDGDYDAFGPPSGFTDIYDDFSDDDDETESIISGGEPLSPSAQAGRESDRLAKDEKRLRVDLEKHKELLVQSQMMNQSLKRCTIAAEAMIKDGKKALEYHVRVSDVKLGGRILTGHEEEDEDREEVIEVEDETLMGGDEAAEDFLKVWQGLGDRPVFEGSEASGGDRDSGIEVDKPSHLPLPVRSIGGAAREHTASSGLLDSGRPPD
ncbi:hypothetical protein LTR78_005330 [Recurvomyces mirabilis]|uniref:Uncharacterized protein n=1 Tax=Recurvomyces mirabilis TaxID=574656 RepID=A0AAE0WNJ8_9PEZI|nr:hypothetical protein LTR78_005330 [Recurvomyces mirabilis]KAK5157882.1 hypothetical protein LTS14_003804 [Recurvomyces mirabilis]